MYNNQAVFCGGFQAGNRETMMNLFGDWVNKMNNSPRMDDQGCLNELMNEGEWAKMRRSTQVCIDSPLISSQHVKTYSKSDFLEHGNWNLDSARRGLRGETP